MPNNWEGTLPVTAACLINARTGNIRTYVVGKVECKQVRQVTNPN
jgi:hypothetical protein